MGKKEFQNHRLLGTVVNRFIYSRTSKGLKYANVDA